jgi:uncharacterized protein
MRFAPEKDDKAYTIRAYQPGQIRVISPATVDADGTGQARELILTCSFIISRQHLIENWPPQRLQELTSQQLQVILDFDPELVILGTGRTLNFPPAEFTEPLTTRGIGVEVMDTAAACRTYNFLMHEGRHVVAALIMD